MLRFLLFALVLALGAGEDIDKYPSGLARNNSVKVFGGFCYKFNMGSSNRKDYHKASAACRTLGGTLAVIKTKEVQTFLWGQLAQNFHASAPVWIGLNDIKEEGTYVWEDNSILKDSNYSLFAHGQGPNHGYYRSSFDEDCVALDPRIEKWKDYRCNTKWFKSQDRDYICQYKLLD